MSKLAADERRFMVQNESESLYGGMEHRRHMGVGKDLNALSDAL